MAVKKIKHLEKKYSKKIAFDNFKCSKISLYKLSVDQSYMERGGWSQGTYKGRNYDYRDCMLNLFTLSIENINVICIVFFDDIFVNPSIIFVVNSNVLSLKNFS